MSRPLPSPILETHDGIKVVRDDLLPGGTKARNFRDLISRSNADEFVYAGPGFGAAQIALAAVAYQLCRQATLFVPWRAERTRYTAEAARYGARIIEVRPGYLSVLQNRAKAYAIERGAELVPFGGGGQSGAITSAAETLQIAPKAVWCAGGSGTLANSLRAAWPGAELHIVKVGRDLPQISGATVYEAGVPFSKEERPAAPFPLHPNYEAKAWRLLQTSRPAGDVLFWNVHG
ncbi:hypothetical protein BKI51_12235 [Alphaproteobacteria bacterium AO1-B]|nr:hypothetical protein BKI51_12235 [Alphaproteobacteria bacterium AO1-B]